MENRKPRQTRKPQIPLDDRKVECLMDAVAQLKGFHNPEAWNYLACNPLGVKSFAPLGRHEIDDQGRRIFPSQLAGIKACLFDLELKIRGESRAGLKTSDKIKNLLGVYEIKELLGQQQVLKWFRRAIKDPTVTLDTELTFFHKTKESR